MKKQTREFLRSFYLTLTIVFCLLLFSFGVGKAYENIVFTSFGEKKTAVRITDGSIRILDFEIEF